MVLSADGVEWTLVTGNMGAWGSILQAALVGRAGHVAVWGGADVSFVYLAESFDGGNTWTRRLLDVTTGAFPVSCALYANGIFALGTTANPGVSGGKFWSSAGLGTYSSQADLLDDTLAPAAGLAKYWAAGGYFRLGAPPAGQITADVTQGAAASNRTAGQVWGAVLTKAGKVSGTDYLTADLTALDTATSSAVVGYYTGLDVVTVADVLDALAGSVGAWWGVDRLGVYRIKQLAAPASPTAYDGVFVEADLVNPLKRIMAWDPNVDLPVNRFVLRYRRYWRPQTGTDVAGAIDQVRVADLAKEWREVMSTLPSPELTATWLLSPTLTEDTLLDLAADALTEANRRQTLYGVQRDRFEFTVALDWRTQVLDGVDTVMGTLVVDLGDSIHLMHSRFGLSAGKYFRVMSIEPDARRGLVTYTIWG